MTYEQLYNRITVGTCCHGQFKVTIFYRNKCYECRSNNTLAYDAIKLPSITIASDYYTEKQALKALWDECKEKNSL